MMKMEIITGPDVDENDDDDDDEVDNERMINT